jgi:hypothetical protein
MSGQKNSEYPGLSCKARGVELEMASECGVWSAAKTSRRTAGLAGLHVALLLLAIASDGALALDTTDCGGNVLDDSAFDEPIVRDHRDSSYGALVNREMAPLGGGEGYGRIVPRSEAGVVRTAPELRAALMAAARLPQTIYVDDAAEIDLSYCARTPTPSGCFEPRTGPLECSDFTLAIPANTTLASGRGRAGSRGAHLFSHTFTDCPLFHVQGPGVRISGLRFHGPDTSIDSDDLLHCGGEASAIQVLTDEVSERWGTEIDNNELSGWPREAVAVVGALGVLVHHYVIQYNRRREDDHTCGEHNYGLGYGVGVGPGSAIIEANVFDHNRHDIASDGRPGAHRRRPVAPSQCGHRARSLLGHPRWRREFRSRDKVCVPNAAIGAGSGGQLGLSCRRNRRGLETLS